MATTSSEDTCVLRYLEGSHGTTTSNGQDDEDTKFMEQEEKQPRSLRPSDDRPRSDDRRLIRQVRARACFRDRTTNADRTSDTSQRPDNRASPDDLHHHHSTKTSE